jgi:hypothetical protein
MTDDQIGGKLPKDADGAPPRRSWIRVAAWCVLGLLFFNIPNILLDPGMPNKWLDSSWVYSLNQAAAQRMAFGRNVIFTLGPYASVYTHAYHPGTVWMMLLGCLLLDVCFVFCFAWLVRPAAWSWAMMLAAIVFAPLIILNGWYFDDWFLSFVLLEALFVFRLLDAGPGEDKKAISIQLAAAIFGCAGMLPLIKCSMLPMQVCVSALCVTFLIFHRRWTMAIICAVAPPIGMLLFWVAAGQHVADLPGFLSGSIQLISGYSEAMSKPGETWQAPLYIAGALAILVAIILARRLKRSLKLFLLLANAFYLLVAFKEGFVRQDDHVYIAFVALAPASLFLMLLQTAQRKRFSMALCSIALLVTTIAIGVLWRDRFTDAVREEGIPPGTFHGLTGWALLTRLDSELGSEKLLKLAVETEPQVSFLHPSAYSLRPWHERFDDAQREINASSQLDFDLQGSVDVYSFEQSALLSRGFDWDPRPVFQSYSAYTPGLIRSNEQHLRGSGAPDHIVFQLETIDGRLPALDDGLSWPAMLDNYRVAEVSGNWVHLARNQGPIRTESRFTLLGATTAQLGQEVVLPPGIGPVFVQIELAPSFYGRLVDMAYKLPMLELTLTCSDNQTAVYRVVPGMMETGFFISPLITDNAGFVRLFNPSQPSTEDNKVLAMRLDSDGRGWSGAYKITFRQYDYGSR